MSREMLVLYRNTETFAQIWCLYTGGHEEADREQELYLKGHDEEAARIWIEQNATIEFFSV